MKSANVSIFVPHAGCPNQCSFCNQRRISGMAEAPSPQDVEQTAREGLKTLGGRAKTAQLAFFGGSFTAIPRDYMVSLLKAAAPFVGHDGFSGIRISTRPDAVDGEILDVLRRYHVRAIELGAQSMDDRVLSLNKRGHTASDVEKASRLIREGGFSLGLQMMTGLPGDSDDGARETARRLADLNPDTMRIYPTLVLKDTVLEEWWREGVYQPPGLEETVRLCAGLKAFFENEGIRVIRLGLHAQESMQQSMLAGPWHPAFGELCDGELYFQKACAMLKGQEAGAYTLFVNPSCVSRMAGQHRHNLMRLSRMGYQCRVKAEEGIPAGEIRLEEKGKKKCC